MRYVTMGMLVMMRERQHSTPATPWDNIRVTRKSDKHIHIDNTISISSPNVA